MNYIVNESEKTFPEAFSLKTEHRKGAGDPHSAGDSSSSTMQSKGGLQSEDYPWESLSIIFVTSCP